MYSLEYIEKLEREHARDSKRTGKIPLFIETEADKNKLNEMSFLGSYTPKGWKKTGKEYFVDSSGFGTEGEWKALTFGQFSSAVEVGFGYAITSAGQFQVYVSQYKYVGIKA